MTRTGLRTLTIIPFLALLAWLLIPVSHAATTGSLVPANDGTYQAWTVGMGSRIHYLNVDETTCNGTSDYMRTSTTGSRESYAVSLSDLPVGSKITKIDITPCASKDLTGFGFSTLNVFYRFNGVNSSDAGGYALSGTTPTGLSATSFSNLNLITSSTATLQVGAVYSVGTKGARMSRIGAMITYESTPTAPTNLTTSTSGTNLLLNWMDNSAFEDGFKVESSTNASTYTQITTKAANITSHSEGPLACGTKWYRVRAYNGLGNSAYTNVATSTIVGAPPSVPASLTVSTAIGGHTVSWPDPSSCETGFRIERNRDGGAYTLVATTTASVTSLFAPVDTCGTYIYRVRSMNVYGDSAWMSSTSTGYVAAPPAAPSNMSASATSTGSGTWNVSLGWTDNASCESNFNIERQKNGGGFSWIATKGAGVTSHVDSVTSTGTYIWRVQSYNAYGMSAYASSTSVPLF